MTRFWLISKWIVPAMLTMLAAVTVQATTVSWINASGGSWNSAGNWSTGVVPGTSDTVLITLIGTYTVTMNVNVTVAALTVGGASGLQTLSASGRTLTLNGSSTVSTYGALTISNSSTIGGSGLLTNQGTLSATSSTINVATDNYGTMVFQGSSCAVNGTLTTRSGSTLRVVGGSTPGSGVLTIANGFTNNGTIELNAAGYYYPATLTVTNGTLTNPAGSTIVTTGDAVTQRYLTARLDNQGTTTLNYDLQVNKASVAHTNSGTINVSGGNLTVSQSGTSPSFTNTGTIGISSGKMFTVSGGTFNQNAGTLGNAGTLVLTSTTANLNTSFAVDSLSVNSSTATFSTNLSTATMKLAFKASTINTDSVTNVAGRTMTVVGNSPGVTINAAVNNYGTMVFQGGFTTTINGALTTQAGSTIHLGVTSGTDYGLLTITNGFTNNGTIELCTGYYSSTTTLAVTSGTLVNPAGSTIVTLGDANATRNLNAQLNNQGTITVNQPLQINKASVAHTNSGTINISGGSLTVTHSGTTPSFSNTGTINLSGGNFTVNQSGTSPSLTNSGAITIPTGRTCTVSGGTFTNGVGGTISGSGALNVSAATFTNSGSLNPGSPLGLLSITGAMSQSTTGVLSAEIGGHTIGLDYDRISLTGNATLGGILHISLANGFMPTLGDVFRIFKYGSHTGTFEVIEGAIIGNGLQFQLQYSDTCLVLLASSVPLCDPPTLASPENQEANRDTSIRLAWHPSTYADTYRVQLSIDSSFATTIVDQSSVIDTLYQLPPLRYNANYFWRVNATNVVGTSSWSQVWSFKTRLKIVASYPYAEDFESSSPGWWTDVVSGTTNDWVVGAPAKTQITGPHNGTKAYVTKTTGPYSYSVDAFVASPVFDFTSLAYPALEFWHNFETYTDWSRNDVGILEVSTNGGAVWQRVDSVRGTGANFTTTTSTNWYNATVGGEIPPPGWSTSSTAYPSHASGWIRSATNLTQLAGLADVRFRWRFVDDKGTFWAQSASRVFPQAQPNQLLLVRG